MSEQRGLLLASRYEVVALALMYRYVKEGIVIESWTV